MIQESRVHILADLPVSAGQYVLYWMQQSQRVRFNHALEYAIREGNRLDLPVIVCFGLLDNFPEANERHYAFLVEGLRDVEIDLKKRGIKFIVRHGQPVEVVVRLAKAAALVVCDRGYLRIQRRWRDDVADHVKIRVVQVESDVVVPVEEASDKQEFAARTLRPKVTRLLSQYLVGLKPTKLKHSSLRLGVSGDIDVSQPAAALAKLKLDRSVKQSTYFTGGEREAQRRLTAFIRAKLSGYGEGRNEPAAGHTSTLSAYLHFGQISALDIALQVGAAKGAPKQDRETYLEELIVRRELSANFCHYCHDYDSYEALPAWAKKTLAAHAEDERPSLYELSVLENAQTHDPFWNAAQLEMTRTGFMHNYMRMYWGKKILEWSRTPEAGYKATLHLNNKHFLCGRDPNAFGNVAWIFGLHDRPWGPARKIFGTIRYMNEAGLRRKFDMEAYVKKVAKL